MAERTCRGPRRALIFGVFVGLIGTPLTGPLAQSASSFGPLGLRTEGWTFFPSLSLTARYDDNIFAVPDDSDRLESDVVFVLSPALRAEANTRRHDFSVSAGAGIGRYQDASDQNFNNFNVRSDGRWAVSRTFDVTGSLSFARRAEDQADPDRTLGDEARRETTNIDTFAASLGVAKDWRRTFARASGVLRRRDFEELNADATDGTTVDLNADRNRWDVPLNFRVGYDMTRNFDVFINLGYRIVRFDEPEQNITRTPAGLVDTVTEGDSQDFETLSLRVGSDLDFDRLVNGSFSVGVEKRFAEEEDEGDDLGFSFDADLDWTLSPRTTLNFAGAQGFEPATGDDAQGTTLRTRVGVDLSYALSRQVALGTDVSYVRDDRTAGERTDNDVAAGVSASYNVNRYAAFSAAYRYRQRNSTVDAREFTRNTVFVTVTARY